MPPQPARGALPSTPSARDWLRPAPRRTAVGTGHANGKVDISHLVGDAIGGVELADVSQLVRRAAHLLQQLAASGLFRIPVGAEAPGWYPIAPVINKAAALRSGGRIHSIHQIRSSTSDRRRGSDCHSTCRGGCARRSGQVDGPGERGSLFPALPLAPRTEDGPGGDALGCSLVLPQAEASGVRHWFATKWRR